MKYTGLGSITLLIITLSLFLAAESVPISYQDENVNCGYQTCHPIKEDHINIHLVPHSHDDVGWVKTVDQYYYGVPIGNYVGAVQYIYQSVLDSLKRYKDRRFIHVETAFFWKWWLLQDEQTREDFTELVMNGQIEFIGGGWAMNDEAVTNYQSTIDQMAWGLRKLNDTFGECGRPKMGWQIDPFGHSSEMASIFAQLGYDGIILGRIDYQDKIMRIANKTMDMVWRGSMSLGQSTDIFTSVLFNLYDAPDRFCFEMSCNNAPLIDDPKSPEFNMENRARLLLENYVHYAIRGYSSSNLLIPMGQDFAYQNAEMWFMNMDKLIKYVNGKEFNGQKYNIIYSTPSCYVYAVYNETKGILKADLKTDDFFPYASDKVSYWTGYYTSRPQLKRFERKANNFLQVSKQLYSLSGISSEHEGELNSLREAMGVMQHHDAITGTEKMVVANDYEKQLSQGIAKCENVTNAALSVLINKDHPRFEHCLLANISQCAYSEKSELFVVTVYNPLSRHISKYVRLPVWGTSYRVTDPSGNDVTTQIMPIHSKISKIPGRTSNATVELIFQAENIPPLGFRSFYIQKQERNDVTPLDNGTFCVHLDKIGFDIDPRNGFVGKIIFENNVTIDLNQTFQYYCGAIENPRPSGAYIFRRDPDISLANVVDKVESNKLYVGPLVTEVHQVYSNMVSQTVRVYHDEQFVEFDWIVGSLPNFMLNGREVITKYSTQLDTDATFYTDSNGREMLKRVRNFRPTWKVTIAEPEPANYYPITSKITLRDDKRNIQFSVLTDRAQGGASLKDGEIELMLHRNTQKDDRLGVDEQLFDWAYYTGVVVRGSHYMVAGHIKPTSETEENIVVLEKDIAERKLLDSWTFISIPTEESFEEYQRANRMEFYGLQMLLPLNLHILTLEPWNEESTFLLRLEHTFAKDEDEELSQPLTINLSELFTTFQIISVRETTLGGNQWLDENKRFAFRSVNQTEENSNYENSDDSGDEFEVKLNPMQIRTFIVKTEPKLFYM